MVRLIRQNHLSEIPLFAQVDRTRRNHRRVVVKSTNCERRVLMRRPTNFDYQVVLDWQANKNVWWAFERMFEMLEHDSPAAWRMVQVMVAYAPSRDLLSLVAAGAD